MYLVLRLLSEKSQRNLDQEVNRKIGGRGEGEYNGSKLEEPEERR